MLSRTIGYSIKCTSRSNGDRKECAGGGEHAHGASALWPLDGEAHDRSLLSVCFPWGQSLGCPITSCPVPRSVATAGPYVGKRANGGLARLRLSRVSSSEVRRAVASQHESALSH